MYSNVDRVKKGWPLLVTLLFLWLGSCDNPVTTDQRADCNHVDAEGLVIERGTSPVAVQWLGTVDGAVELDYGRRSGEMAVTFLDPDSSRVLGRAVCGQSLGWVVEDTAIVSIEPVPGDDWRVFMTGSRPGSTLVRFRVWHYEHADFTSQPIPVRVSGAICPPPTVAGAAAIDGTDTLFTVLNGSVTGSLDLAGAGDSLTVRIDWLDASGAALAIGDSCGNFSVSWTATDTSLADIVVAAGPPWVATVVPRADGSGSVQFHFADQGTTLFSTAPIPITVSGLACDSIQPAGLEATLTDSTLATSFGGLVAGGLTVTEGTQLSPVALDFLASDSAVIAIPTDCSDLSLDWSVGNDSLVAVILDSTWSVDINGLAPGSTFVQFKMLDQGIPIYTSPNLPVLVEPAQTHVPVDSNLFAVSIQRNCNQLLSWNYNLDNGPKQSIGYLVLQEGETLLDLEFVTLDTSANSEGERYELDLIDPRYTIDWQITDESRASFTPHPTDPFAFDASGHSAGATQVTFRLLYDGQPELVTKPFTIVVRPSGQTAADSASFMITKGGVWHVVCRDGTLLNDECNLIGPSEFVVGAGEYTSLYSYWLPKATDSCGREDFSTGLRYLAYDVEDPCIATVVNHPVHWGEERVFHIKGLQAGETTVRIYLINRVTQSVIQASPPIPVRITP